MILKPRVLLDSNVLISAVLFPHRKLGEILECWQEGEFDLIISEPLYEEVVENLLILSRYYGFSPRDVLNFGKILQEFALWVEIIPQAKVCRDEKDNQVLDTAFQGKADFLVSGDKDLLVLKKYRRIPILTPAKFLKESS